MSQIKTRFANPIVAVWHMFHPEGEHHEDGQTEVPDVYGFTFVESGAFRVVRGRACWDFGEADVLLCYPGQAQRIFHPPSGAHDVCAAIVLPQATLEDALGKLPQVLARPKISASPATRFQFWRLQQAMSTGDEFVIESLAVSAALAFLPPGRYPLTQSAIDRNHAWYRKRVSRVCELLDAGYAEKHSLEKLARLAHMSPFHFNRVFKYLVGQPPHQYLLHRRLTAAARDLREGRSVSDAAYGSGFTNLAYFSRSFRSRFGVAPSHRKSKKVKAALLPVR